MKDYASELYEDRLLLFIETEHGFRNVHLNERQFKIISEVVAGEVLDTEGDIEIVKVTVDDEKVLPLELFEGMNSIEL